MRLMIIAAGAALLIAAPLSAQADTKVKEKAKTEKDAFARQDLDSNGKLTLEEVLASKKEKRVAIQKCCEQDDDVAARQEVYDKYDGFMTVDEFLLKDQDGDHILTRSDLKAASEDVKYDESDAKSMADAQFDEWLEYTGKEGDSIKLSAFYDRAKEDFDSVRNSVKNNPAKRHALVTAHSNLDSYMIAVRADANDDEIITRDELTMFYTHKFNSELAERWTKQQKKRTEKDLALYHQAYRLQVLAGLDADEDGTLSREETDHAYNPLNDTKWKKYDANQDGVLDRGELNNVADDPDQLLIVFLTEDSEDK